MRIYCFGINLIFVTVMILTGMVVREARTQLAWGEMAKVKMVFRQAFLDEVRGAALGIILQLNRHFHVA